MDSFSTEHYGKFTTFHVDVQSMLMVIVISWCNKFLVCAVLTQKAEFSEFVLLTQPLLQCLHVPGCIARKLLKLPTQLSVQSTVVAHAGAANITFPRAVKKSHSCCYTSTHHASHTTWVKWGEQPWGDIKASSAQRHVAWSHCHYQQPASLRLLRALLRPLCGWQKT